jgi:DNA modification methylase
VARARIVLETSQTRKTAMARAADLQGETLTDWLEEQVSSLIPRTAAGDLASGEICDPAQLMDAGERFASLQATDWSFTNEDTGFLTHDLHPFPAKFIPQIPAALIEALSVRGDLVCDPFGGSATTAVEAIRLRRRAVSVDANPLGELIGRVKTGYLTTSARTQLGQLIAAVDGHLLALVSSRGHEDLRERYAAYIPAIPHLDKWFTSDALGELALIRHVIDQITEGLARDAAQIALSRIVIRVSNQDSETRYVAVSKSIGPSFTLRAYLESLKTVVRRLETSALDLQFGQARFITADSRDDLTGWVGENTVDLIATSPPYPNATDYHLYHRFRLFWLGFDPRDLADVEIGSHLRHQRNNTGFDEYRSDLAQVMEGCFRVLQPGRYAVFVVGDALFKGELFSTADATAELAASNGFEVIGALDRAIHGTRRSFAKPARRARAEQIVVLRKPNQPIRVLIGPPAYKLWPFEARLRLDELATLTGDALSQDAAAGTGVVARPTSLAPASQVVAGGRQNGQIALDLRQPSLWHLRRLAFSSEYSLGSGQWQPTWQRVLENGDADPARRKDPKYATHGLHPFKGKFYPQLAKALLNISGASVGGVILDPFCGSGTMLLEGMLNGFDARGSDFNPLAAKMSRAKTGILTVPIDTVDRPVRALLDRLALAAVDRSGTLEQFSAGSLDELRSWFPEPVLHKLNWLLGQIRVLGNATVVDYLEVVLSSIVREISQQEPTDLRIRRRKEPLEDAPVLELFHAKLGHEHGRLLKYWSVAGRQPGAVRAPRVAQGDSRLHETFEAIGLTDASVDCVITSPPYATALPYIDTDRLSLLAIMGIEAPLRSQLERDLTGSREITRKERLDQESQMLAAGATSDLPGAVVDAIRGIHEANSTDEVGFRRANMASLLWRYFIDMKANLAQVSRTMKPGAKAFYVVGDSRTNAGGTWVTIRTCESLVGIAESVGLEHVDSMSIDVTTERFQHMKNAITENQVLVLQKPLEPAEFARGVAATGH